MATKKSKRQPGRPDPAARQPTDTELFPRADAGGTLLPVRVVPRAAHMELDGVRAGALLVRLIAPPVEGAANSALITFLADRLGVPKSALTITAGATSRQKTLRIDGLTPQEVLARLNLPPA